MGIKRQNRTVMNRQKDFADVVIIDIPVPIKEFHLY